MYYKAKVGNFAEQNKIFMNSKSTIKVLFWFVVCTFAPHIASAQKNTIRIAQKTVAAPKDSVKAVKIDSLKQMYDLPELTVTATRPLVKIEMDRIIYNMAEDPDAKTQTVLDMLRKVPLITVDGEDKISLKGTSDFVVYLNGKPSGMFRQNPEEVLRNMPAGTVRNIEVITNPGAKYDAEGVAGIINLVTIRQTSLDGYTATLRGGINTQVGGTAGIYLTVQKGKIGFTGNLNSFWYNYPSSNIDQTSNNFFDNSIIFEKTKRDRDSRNFLSGSGVLSFEIDTLNLVNIGYNARYGRQNSFLDGMISQTQGDNFIYAVDRTSKENSNRGGTEINVDYQHTSAKNAKRFLTLSYLFAYSPNNTESESHFFNPNPIDNFPAYIPLDSRKQYTDARTNEHTFQADYTMPFGKNHSIETGVKYILRLNKSNSDYLTFDDIDGWLPLYPQGDERNDVTLFEHRNNIVAAYGSYTLQLGKWGLRTGLRYEYTFLNVEFERNPKRNFNKDYSNLIPSILGTYKINDAQNIRLGYNIRINRPGIWQLNPYIDDSNPNFIAVGNPNLNAVLAHTISLNYGFFKKRFSLNADLSQQLTNNSIEQITRINNGTSISTYENIGKRQDTRLTGYFKWSLVQWFNLYSNFGGSYTDIRVNNGSLPNRNSFECWAYSGLDYRLPWKIWLTGYLGVRSPRKTLQTTTNVFLMHWFALRRDFLNDRLNVRIAAQDPFIKKYKRKATVENPTFYQEQNLTIQPRWFVFIVSYRFGELKAILKKTAKSIKNDDVMESEQNQDGGG